MIRQLRWLYFHQIRLHVFDDPAAHPVGKKIDNRGMNFRSGGKRPAFATVAIDDFSNLVGQFFINTPFRFRLELALPDRGRSVMRAGHFGYRETAGKVRDLVDESTVRIGNVERLH